MDGERHQPKLSAPVWKYSIPRSVSMANVKYFMLSVWIPMWW